MTHDRSSDARTPDPLRDGEDRSIIHIGDAIFVSGQTGVRAGGCLGRGPEAAAMQADFALRNLERLLEQAGASLEDVCKLTVYIDDRAHRIPVYRTIGRHLRGVHPVSTGLIVRGFSEPEALFALDVAVVSQRSGAHRRLRKYHSDAARYGNELQALDCEFCMVVRAGRHIFLRGQTGQTIEDRLLVRGDARAQAVQAMRNVELLLGEADAWMSDICRVVLYVTDRAHLAPARDAVLAALEGIPCAMSEIVVKGLASTELLMEVDVFAMRS
jgi:enamine deaminase RidA (YjgF/YER057c/UK114 family)